MRRSLEQAVTRTTERFARELLAIFRSAVLGDLVALEDEGVARAPRASRRGASSRRSAGRRARIDHARISNEILGALKEVQDGLSSESLQRALRRKKREIFPTLSRLLRQGAITKTGQKRGTRYFAK
jgi:hypothetical protein